MFRTTIHRSLTAGAALALVVGLGACDTIDRVLDVENPERISESQLQDEKLVEILVNSTIGEFQDALDDPYIWRGSMFTDMQVTGINWEGTARLNQRLVRFQEGDPDVMFLAISRARATADSVAGRLKGTGGDPLIENPTSDERLARVLNTAGYSYIMMADVMCEATINQEPTRYTPLQVYQFAADRFAEALTVANAAGSQDMVDLAQVGLSRAHLNLGNAAETMAAASAVTMDYRQWAQYHPDANSNTLFARVTGGNHALGMHPAFLQGTFGETVPAAQQTDPRIQHLEDFSRGHNQLTPLYKPYQPWSYSGHTPIPQSEGGEPILFEENTSITYASWLEAMYNYYEAAGPAATGPAGTTLEFVNSRRAVGRQADLAGPTDAELMADLRDQRARDLFLAGFRLGDLRRYLRQGVGDFFPSGPHVNEQWGLYGDATCFPLPVEEEEANPAT